MRDKGETVATLIGALFFVLILAATVGGGIYGIIHVLSGDDDVSEVESDNTSQNENWEAEAEENKRDIELSRELCNINMKDFMSLCLQYRNSVGRFPLSVADLSNFFGFTPIYWCIHDGTPWLIEWHYETDQPPTVLCPYHGRYPK